MLSGIVGEGSVRCLVRRGKGDLYQFSRAGVQAEPGQRRRRCRHGHFSMHSDSRELALPDDGLSRCPRCVIVCNGARLPRHPRQLQGTSRLSTTRCTETAMSALGAKPAITPSTQANAAVIANGVLFHLFTRSYVASRSQCLPETWLTTSLWA